MNVFFDLECANCHKNVAKICEFGYVLADDNLNIIEADNLLINPKAPFNIYGFEKAGLKLSYTQEEYKKHPPLKNRYPFIKSLLADPANNVFGYSVDSDAEYLASDCQRSGIYPCSFRFIDVMRLFKIYLKRTEKLSLDAVYTEFYGESDLTHHEAKNDSIMTLKVFRAFLDKSGVSLKDVINGYPLAHGELFFGKVVKDGTVFHYTPGNHLSPTNKRILDEFMLSVRPSEKLKDPLNKSFYFEKSFTKDHFAQLLVFADRLAELGGRLTFVMPKADYIVATSSEPIAKTRRQKILDLPTFLSMLSLDESIMGDVDPDPYIAKIPKNRVWYAAYTSMHRKNEG